MNSYFEEQIILQGQTELIYCEFRDDLGVLIDPTSPKITIYSPSGGSTPVVFAANMTKQSTGVCYYPFLVNVGEPQGYYQAWFSGEIGGHNRTIDAPKPLYVRQAPWNWGLQYDFIRSVRRAIGDTDPADYRIQDRELIYYIKDAINEIQALIPLGYTATITPDGISFSPALTTRAETLFKWQTVLLVLESNINKQSYGVGYINVGDIVIDRSKNYGAKANVLRDQYNKIQKFIKDIISDEVTGVELITFGIGTPITSWW